MLHVYPTSNQFDFPFADLLVLWDIFVVPNESLKFYIWEDY